MMVVKILRVLKARRGKREEEEEDCMNATLLSVFILLYDTIYTVIKFNDSSGIGIEDRNSENYVYQKVRLNRISRKYIPEYRFAILFPEEPSFLEYLFSIILFV